MAPRPGQPDGWGHAVPAHQHDAPAPAAGPAFVVSRDEVLAKHKALLDEVNDFRTFLDSIQQDLYMEPMGGDPVSGDVGRAVTHRIRDDPDSYWHVCDQWVTNLQKTADALAEIARQYGYTDEDIAASLRGSASRG
ncbi:MAG TPA: hypothetical protein VGJ13_09800 [Pseudonocardiaceae bacterium]|jgi:hypothetical protein